MKRSNLLQTFNLFFSSHKKNAIKNYLREESWVTENPQKCYKTKTFANSTKDSGIELQNLGLRVHSELHNKEQDIPKMSNNDCFSIVNYFAKLKLEEPSIYMPEPLRRAVLDDLHNLTFF